MNLKQLNDLTAKEWAQSSRSVWKIVPPPRYSFQLEHGATFPLKLAEQLIQIYSKRGDIVLDPFLGTGTTLIAAKNLGRSGYGFELYPNFYKIACENLNSYDLFQDERETKIFIYNEDCRKILDFVPENHVQLVLTSPPYVDSLHKITKDRTTVHKNSLLVKLNRSAAKLYGNDPRDFGNLDYENFLRELEELMKKLYRITQYGGYGVWIVKDFRDTEKGKPLIPLHSDVGKIGENAGFVWHDLIIWDQNEQRKLIVLGYPSKFYVNINHSFLVVLRKPERR